MKHLKVFFILLILAIMLAFYRVGSQAIKRVKTYGYGDTELICKGGETINFFNQGLSRK